MSWRRFRRAKWLQILGFQRHKEAIDRWRRLGLTSVIFIGLAFIVSLQGNELQPEDDLSRYSLSSSRRLLSVSNESESLACAYEKEHLPIAWVISHCICTLIVFIALAIICDDFFVPSLEIISEKLNLSEDVAGATFMAAGSSAPELFTSVAGVAQKTDVGVGTIVGSAVFNLLIIIALTAALAGKVLHLDWRPLIRDSFFYAMSIGCFIGFSWDGYFQHYEGAILLSLYILYIVIMIFNPRIVNWMATWEKCCKPEVSPSGDAEKPNDLQTQLNHIEAKGAEGRRLSLTGGHARRVSIIQRERSQSEERIFRHKRGSVAGVLICPPPKYLTGRKDSSVAVPDGSSGLAGTDTSHPDLQRSAADGERPKSRGGAGGLRNGYLAANPGSPPSDDIEMAAVELPAITKAGNGRVQALESAARTRTSRYKRTYSEDIPSLREEDPDEANDDPDAPHHDHGKLQRSVSERRPSDAEDAPAPPRTTTDTTANTTPHTNNPKHRPGPGTPTDANQTAQALMAGEQETRSRDHVNSDLYPSESALQNSQLPRYKSSPDPPTKENEGMKKSTEDDDDEEAEETMQICPCCPCCPPVRTYPPSSHEARQKGGFVSWLKLIVRWVIFIPAFPFVCLFSWTIPECSKEHLKKYYLLSFFVSVAWIAGLSYAMVTMVERTGCILGIDSYIMGLVVVAIGTSVPDAMSSILVARDGYGDMAVSNAIGSNVFDINLGLGLPFITRIAIDKGAPIDLLEKSEWVAYFTGRMIMTPHAKFGFILLLILVLCLIIFAAVRFRLNKWIGITFLIIYIVFLVYAFLQELYCARKLDSFC